MVSLPTLTFRGRTSAQERLFLPRSSRLRLSLGGDEHVALFPLLDRDLLLHGGQQRHLVIEEAEVITRLDLVGLEQQFLTVIADDAFLPRHGFAVRIGGRPHHELLALDAAALHDFLVAVEILRHGDADDLAVGRLVAGHGPALGDDAVVALEDQMNVFGGVEDFLAVALDLFDGGALMAGLDAVQIGGVPQIEEDFRSRRRLLGLDRNDAEQDHAAPREISFHRVSLR